MHELLAVLGLTVLLSAVGAHAAEVRARVVTPQELSRVLLVRDVVAAGPVTGEVVNLSDETLEEVRLLVEDQFYWSDEMHPGDYSPERSSTFNVEHVPPHSAVPFRFDRPPLPARSDGRFETTVTVLGVTSRPVPMAHSEAAPPAARP